MIGALKKLVPMRAQGLLVTVKHTFLEVRDSSDDAEMAPRSRARYFSDSAILGCVLPELDLSGHSGKDVEETSVGSTCGEHAIHSAEVASDLSPTASTDGAVSETPFSPHCGPHPSFWCDGADSRLLPRAMGCTLEESSDGRSCPSSGTLPSIASPMPATAEPPICSSQAQAQPQPQPQPLPQPQSQLPMQYQQVQPLVVFVPMQMVLPPSPAGFAAPNRAAQVAAVPAAAPRPVTGPTVQSCAVPVAGAAPVAPSAAAVAAREPECRCSGSGDLRIVTAQAAPALPDERRSECSAAGRTTVMLRNIPNNYTRARFLALLDSQGFESGYDFVYLPCDFNTGNALGYAFVNLVDSSMMDRFWRAFQGFKRWGMASRKRCDVSWCEPHQGFDANMEHYRNSPIMHSSVPDDYKPIIFSRGARIPYPAPTQRIRVPRTRRC